MKSDPDFQTVFTSLRAILRKRAGSLTVTTDTDDEFCVSLDYSPKFKKGFPVAWIKIGKAYVSYHLMPVYMFPKLQQELSKKLRARMQGKSCFNFKAVDTELFGELDAITAKGFAMSREAGISR